MNTDNPWVDRFPELDDSILREKIKFIPDALVGLNHLPVETACIHLESSFSELFVPTAQSVKCIQEIIGRARAHCSIVYADRKSFLKGVYAKDVPLPDFYAPVCLTGLAGVGKSEIINALKKVLAPSGSVRVDSEHSPFPLVSGWFLSIREKTALSHILLSLLNDVSEEAGLEPIKKRRLDIPKLLDDCRFYAYKAGLPLLVADEFQFISRSENANALVTKVLMHLASLGIPVIFVSNFSMCHRIKKRPQEDVQRLLSHPYVLMPDGMHSEDWVETLKGFRGIAPEVFEFDPVANAEEIYGWTAGLKRLLKILLIVGYRRARSVGANVGVQELQWAYMSAEYSMNREDVRLILQQYVTEECARSDLWCPFELPKSEYAAIKEEVKKTDLKKMGIAMIEDSMTPGEREIYESLNKSASASLSNAEIVPLKPKKSIINKDIREGGKCLKKLFLNEQDVKK